MLSTVQTDVTTIHADKLTEGDIVRYFTGDLWQVANEPIYTTKGIEFEVLNLSTEHRETQKVSFHPQWRFELVDYSSNYELVMEVAA